MVQRNKRFKELSDQAEKHNAYYFTDFMTMADAAGVFDTVPENNVTVFGGADDCERVMLRFGDPKEFGYEEPFPITLLKIVPVMPKFADVLTHRDYLGTLMGLGIERDVIGDIIVKNDGEQKSQPKGEKLTSYKKSDGIAAYVFVATRMVPFLKEHLTKVKHTPVFVTELSEVPDDVTPNFSEEEVIVSSMRLDGVIAKFYHLSREKAKQLFTTEMIFINGKVNINPSLQPKEGDIISVRGYGKFIFDGSKRETKKGNIVVLIRRYI